MNATQRLAKEYEKNPTFNFVGYTQKGYEFTITCTKLERDSIQDKSHLHLKPVPKR